jgi:hypothetical protein
LHDQASSPNWISGSISDAGGFCFDLEQINLWLDYKALKEWAEWIDDIAWLTKQSGDLSVRSSYYRIIDTGMQQKFDGG